jgi:hypothetical protein
MVLHFLSSSHCSILPPMVQLKRHYFQELWLKHSHYKFPGPFFLKTCLPALVTVSFGLKVDTYTRPADVHVSLSTSLLVYITEGGGTLPIMLFFLYKILTCHVFLTHRVHISVISLLEPICMQSKTFFGTLPASSSLTRSHHKWWH